MGSIFLNVGLVAGVALAAIPVLLHLFMRQTPKHVIFPALRLIRERQKRTRKRMRIKNWLLLLARMALIALMALALARPRLWSRTTGGDNVPTAMALVFDTSLSMEYKEQDRTRLDEAKERARALIGRLGESSRVFVIDGSEPVPPPGLSPGAARKRIDSLAIRPVTRPLNAAVGQAYKAVAPTEQPRHEVYVFTDLARSAWDTSRTVEALDVAKADKTEVPVYVVRVAPESIRDAAIVEAEPMGDFVSKDDPVPIRAVIRSTGPATRRLVEFLVEGKKRGQKEVQVPADGQAEVQFPTPNTLGAGLRRVEVRLAGEPDPLDADDHRFLTLDLQPPVRVLVVSDVDKDADFVEFALDPLTFRAGGSRPFPVTRVVASQLGSLSTPLKDFGCIFLLNVASLPGPEWGRLNQYVREGGGLVVALGDRVQPDVLNAAAGSLLPAEVGALQEPKEADFTFGKSQLDHPVFSFDSQALQRELLSVPILRYRSVKPISGARTLLAYKNDEPALLERVFPGPRTGHVLLWTTALSRRPGNTAAELKAAWNEFPIQGWSFFAVMNQTVPYLAGLTGRRLNYEAGEDVTLALEPGRRYTTFAVQAPGAQSADKLSEPISGGLLTIPQPPVLGQWTVTAGSPGSPATALGFSVNYPQAEMQHARLSEKELDSLFGGKDRYKLADDTEDLRKVAATHFFGREIFPWLMGLILLVLTLENILANTFYRDRPAGGSVISQRAAA